MGNIMKNKKLFVKDKWNDALWLLLFILIPELIVGIGYVVYFNFIYKSL